MIRATITTLGRLFLFILLGLGFLILLVRSSLFQEVDILFYRGFLLCLVAAFLILLVASLMWRHRWADQLPLIIAAAALSFSVNLTFLIVVPVTIDRSISVFLLAGIDKEAALGRIVTADKLRTLFINTYVVDMNQIERRIEEQSRSGNIVVRQEQIHLTPRGAEFLDFARLVARFWGTDQRFVYANTQKDMIP